MVYKIFSPEGSASFLPRSPLRAIRARCLDCQGHQYSKVRYCDDAECPLWPFRFGRRPETVIMKEGEKSEQLFNPKNFRDRGKFTGVAADDPEES